MNGRPGPGTRLVFVANTMYSHILSGGDVHTLNMAVEAARAEYPLHFLAGHALQGELQRRGVSGSVTLTDRGVMRPRDFNSISGQVRLLGNFFGRFVGTMQRLSDIRPEDIVYANTDYWWDSWPAILSKATRKVMILGMDCPTFGEILRKSRPDVRSVRFPSVHYWLSQNIALRWFQRCRKKRLLYVHPNQKQRLLKLGYREEELVYVGNGMDLSQADLVPEQPRIYDVAWTGRIHQQKGIDDLLKTLRFLAGKVEGFRAMIIGNVESTLKPLVEGLGLRQGVEFSGYVSEAEKFRLLKSSRVFLMPSRYESWGIVVAEALACGTPVVAYELDAYRPVFGGLVDYVPRFDQQRFQQAALERVEQGRRGATGLDDLEMTRFKAEHSWAAAAERFLTAIRSLEVLPP